MVETFARQGAPAKGRSWFVGPALRRWTTCLLAVTALLICISGLAPAAETIEVTLDFDPTVKIPAGVTTIVIGNPLIADAHLLTADTVVITGKSYGATNMIMLDRKGSVLTEKSILVRSPDDAAVVYCGVTQSAFIDVLCPDAGKAPTGNSKGPVHVQGYTRANGTQVRSHDRALPGQGTK